MTLAVATGFHIRLSPMFVCIRNGMKRQNDDQGRAAVEQKLSPSVNTDLCLSSPSAILLTAGDDIQGGVCLRRKSGIGVGPACGTSVLLDADYAGGQRIRLNEVACFSLSC